MKQNQFLKKSNLSLEDIENKNSEILQRISNDLAKKDVRIVLLLEEGIVHLYQDLLLQKNQLKKTSNK